MQSKREVIWWALGTIREAYEKVVKEEAGRLGIVRENLRKSTDFLRANLCAGRWNERSHFVVCLPALQEFSSGGLYLVGFDGEEARQQVVCKSVESYEWRAPNRILVVQLGTNDDEAKASRAHVVPQGLCENLTNTLKLLANQKDGDRPIQNIIMGLQEKCRERTTNLRSFIASDNYSAVEVGHLRRGQRPFKVVRPKMNGHRSEVLREGADDLTVRAEEFATLKACLNVDHIVKKMLDTAHGGRRLVRNFPSKLKKELKEVSGKSCAIAVQRNEQGKGAGL